MLLLLLSQPARGHRSEGHGHAHMLSRDNNYGRYGVAGHERHSSIPEPPHGRNEFTEQCVVLINDLFSRLLAHGHAQENAQRATRLPNGSPFPRLGSFPQWLS